MKQDGELGSLSAVAPETPSSAVKDRGLTSLQPMQFNKNITLVIGEC